MPHAGIGRLACHITTYIPLTRCLPVDNGHPPATVHTPSLLRTVGGRVTAATSLSTVTSPFVTEVSKGDPHIAIRSNSARPTNGRLALRALCPNTAVSIAENDEQTDALSPSSALLEETYQTLQLTDPRELWDRSRWIGPEHRVFEEPYGTSA